MGDKTLVVVESPAKAKTINKYLGKNFIVEASVGHIKDLIPFRLGVNVAKDFQPTYTTIKGKNDIIKKLKQLAEKVDQVLIATDPDREGEAIAWHIAEEIRKKNPNIKRVLFNEITKTGVKKGLDDPRDIDINLFMSQQARRVMDRLIGYKVSPFVSNALVTKTDQALSAGRVQSVALRIICEREAEILAFVPIEYWSILGEFKKEKSKSFKARLVSFDGKAIKNPEGSAEGNTKLSDLNFIRTEEQAVDLVNRIQNENYSISDVTKKKVKRNPFAPFTTSSLQQEASRRLGFTNKKTMSVAQKLYEGVTLGKEGSVGLITYMRTDSVRISPEAQDAARDHINKVYGDEYLPDKTPVYTSKSQNVQDAHEAIRPTSLEYSPKEVEKYLEKDMAKLYELIYNRFLASQMKAAQYDQTTIEITGGKFIFRVTGSVLTFKGFLAIYGDIEEDKTESDKESEIKLPEGLDKGSILDLLKLEKQKSQTKPAPRYNSASLVKELDEKGIGRPSTYATIVSTLLDRNYVELQSKAFVPTELGKDVNNVLTVSFPDLFNVKFTAEMEEELDTVAIGKSTYVDILTQFYNPFSDTLKKAEKLEESSEIMCDVCGAPMIIRVSRKGRFLGCSRYPECKNTKPLPKPDGSEKAAKAEPVIAEGIFCDLCGKPMVIRESRYGKFYGCIDYPKCKGIKKIEAVKTATDDGQKADAVTCPKCKDGKLLERFSRKTKKKFWGCSNYPKCDYITNYEPYNKPCPNCHNYYLETHFRKKDEDWEKFLKCPNCSETYELEKVVA